MSSPDPKNEVPVLPTNNVDTDRRFNELTTQLSQLANLVTTLSQQVSNSPSATPAAVRRRERRRQSMGRPSVSNTSAWTDPVFSPRAPVISRPSVEQRFDVLLEEEDDDEEEETDDGVDEKSESRIHPSSSSPGSLRASTVPIRSVEERTIIRKAMSNMPKPEKFTGTTEAEKDGVEQWVLILNHFLDGQFQGVDAPKERMIMVLQFLKGPALEWMQSVYAGQSDRTWEELQVLFIQHIRGSRDARDAAREKMKQLAYGKGRAQDLLSYDAAFEELRVKLYPSSTTNREMNERSAEDYQEGIRRGSVEVFIEMKRCLATRRQPGTLPTLAECKSAAADAVTIVRALRDVNRSSSNYSHSWRPSQSTSSRPTTANVQNVQAHVREVEGEEETWERQEGEERDEVNKIHTRPMNKSPGMMKQFEERGWGNHLTLDQRRQLMRQGKCWLCYQRGHVARSCPDKDKGGDRRPPAKEDLNL
jgi:hypothetical protein